MTIWSLILVVLAGISLAAGWRLRLNEPILVSIGLSAAALLLLIVSMIRDRSAKRKTAPTQASAAQGERPTGVSQGRPQPAAAGYGATAFQPVLPSSIQRFDGSTSAPAFTESPSGAGPVTPLEEALRDLANLRSPEPEPEPEPSPGPSSSEPETTVQILPAAEEPLELHAEERIELAGAEADAGTVTAETEAFALEPAEAEAFAPEPVEAEITPVPERSSPEVAPEPPAPVPAPVGWGFHYLVPSSSPDEDLVEPDGPSEPVSEHPPEPPSGPEADQRNGVRAASPRAKPPRRKPPGKLVYWWETSGQGSPRAAADRPATMGSPAPKPKGLPKDPRPADSPQEPSLPPARLSDDVSATPAARTRPPEITIRLVPTPKKQAKPGAKRAKAKAANGKAASTTSTSRSVRRAPTTKTSQPSERPEHEIAGRSEPATEERPTGKPAPPARTRPMMASKPATKLRATARPKTKPRKTDSADASQARPASPPEEKPFKYLD